MYRVKSFVCNGSKELDTIINQWLDGKDCEIVSTSYAVTESRHSPNSWYHALVTYKVSYDCKCANDL